MKSFCKFANVNNAITEHANTKVVVVLVRPFVLENDFFVAVLLDGDDGDAVFLLKSSSSDDDDDD